MTTTRTGARCARHTLAALALLPALACGGDDSRPEMMTSIGSITITTSPGTTTGMDTGETTMEAIPDIGADDTGPPNDTDGCAEVSDQAMVGVQPADILVVVDNSGSMSMEAGFVQANMNTFSSQIFLANIDARVVLISADDSDDAGICLPQPLGSGACPDDTNLPGYLHIVDGVGSNNGLQKILDHSATWLPQFRATASKHIILVSDDDSSLSANAFDQAFRALDPSLEDYTFHAIASPEDPVLACIAMTSCCPALIPLSADISQEYIDLAALTGGIFGNLCEQNFGPIFDQVSTQVVSGASLACEYDIPPPPDGMDFNPDQVNVEFDDGAGGTLDIGRVDSPADCAGVSHGWYYDDPMAPTRIIVCPQTCDEIQGFNMASISIKFGCATVPAA